MLNPTTSIRAGWFCPPGGTISDSSEYRGWTERELAERLGLDEQSLKDLINGDIPLSHDIAFRLERKLGGTAAFWMRLEARYREGRYLESNGYLIIDATDITPIDSVDSDAAIEGARQAIAAAREAGEPLDLWPGRVEALRELGMEDDDEPMTEIAADLLARRIESSKYLTYDKPIRDGGSWIDTDSRRSYEITACLELSQAYENEPRALESFITATKLVDGGWIS
ncbi:MAG: helix-turn-helix domain-containing protein [Ectothiorhodospiraceae bacterium AqS1]|nr:helix-turn-helix domain-containing protein [Ectothiorhodospiraceae bacterium AqS1]